jgi:hypothetical protein
MNIADIFRVDHRRWNRAIISALSWFARAKVMWTDTIDSVLELDAATTELIHQLLKIIQDNPSVSAILRDFGQDPEFVQSKMPVFIESFATQGERELGKNALVDEIYKRGIVLFQAFLDNPQISLLDSVEIVVHGGSQWLSSMAIQFDGFESHTVHDIVTAVCHNFANIEASLENLADLDVDNASFVDILNAVTVDCEDPEQWTLYDVVPIPKILTFIDMIAHADEQLALRELETRLGISLLLLKQIALAVILSAIAPVPHVIDQFFGSNLRMYARSFAPVFQRARKGKAIQLTEVVMAIQGANAIAAQPGQQEEGTKKEEEIQTEEAAIPEGQTDVDQAPDPAVSVDVTETQ